MSCSLKTLVFLTCVLSIAAACTRPVKEKSEPTAVKDLNSNDGFTEATVSTSELSIRDNRFGLASSSNKPHYFFLDADSLEAKFFAYFGTNNPRGLTGYEWNSIAKLRFFTPAERSQLGTLNLRSEVVSEQNGAWLDSITQDYVSIIRRSLGDSCQKLIAAETTAPAAGNRLIRSSSYHLVAPTPDHINEVMTAMFGYALPSGALHTGAADYSALFEANRAEYFAANPSATTTAKQTFAKNQYIAMCVAIAQDVRTYLR